MWPKLSVILTVAMATVVKSNFCPSFAPFYSDYGYALVGHVIKSLSLFKPDCMAVCQKTLICFSISIYKDQNGIHMCDLNRSNKKQSPESFVRKTGYEYAQPQEMRFCVKEDCPVKDALPGNMFRFNSSIFKLIIDRKKWTDARQQCQALGGDLASFTTETEYKFVFEAMSHYIFLLVTAVKRLFMDGTDTELSLIDGASLVTKDNMQALYLDGIKGGMFATTPRFVIHKTDLTFGVWVKTPKPGDEMYIFSDRDKDDVMVFSIFMKGSLLKIELWSFDRATKAFKSERKVPENEWIHLAFTWQRTLGRVTIYFNGIMDVTKDDPLTSDSNKDLFLTNRPFYVIGRKYDEDKTFNGWMRDLVVVFQVLSAEEIVLLKDGKLIDGAWIGLNDKVSENQIQWSDGTPLTYQSNGGLSNTNEKDCGYINGNITTRMWNMTACDKTLPFICEMPIV